MSANEDAKKLLDAFLVGSPRGSVLLFAAEVAGISDEGCLKARNHLEARSVLVKVIEEPRQQFKVPVLMHRAHSSVYWNLGLNPENDPKAAVPDLDGVRERHYAILNSTAWSEERDCLNEMVAAGRWLFDRHNSQRPLEDFTYRAFATIRGLEPHEVALVERFGSANAVYRRHLYVEARLLWMFSQKELEIHSPDQSQMLKGARGRLEDFIGLCGEFDWREKAHAKGILALMILDDFLRQSPESRADDIKVSPDTEESLRLLLDQAELHRSHNDLSGYAASLGVRACVLLQHNRLEEARKVLDERWPVVVRLKSRQPLSSIDEIHDNLPGLWEEYIRRQEYSRGDPDGDLYTNRADVQNADLFTDYGDARGAFGVPDMLMADSVPEAERGFEPTLLEQTLLEHSAEHLASLDKREKKLRGAYREEERSACYANMAKMRYLRGRSEKEPRTLQERSEEFRLSLQALKEQEKLCRRLKDRQSLQTCFGYQAIIRRELHEPADALFERKFALGYLLWFEELAAYAHWRWGLIAALDGDPESARHYLLHADSLMEDLQYDDERDLILADLESLPAGPRASGAAGA